MYAYRTRNRSPSLRRGDRQECAAEVEEQRKRSQHAFRDERFFWTGRSVIEQLGSS
jgi:hypothetical protein